MPPGVKRHNGAKCRVDYFDSKQQVFQHISQAVKNDSLTSSDDGKQCDNKQPLQQAAFTGKRARLDETTAVFPKKGAEKGGSSNITMAKKEDGALSWEEVWKELQSKGWRTEIGPRGNKTQVYYMPPGVKRGPGTQNRLHYFDSKVQVLQKAYGLSTALPQGDVAPLVKRSRQEKKDSTPCRPLHGWLVVPSGFSEKEVVELKKLSKQCGAVFKESVPS